MRILNLLFILSSLILFALYQPAPPSRFSSFFFEERPKDFCKHWVFLVVFFEERLKELTGSRTLRLSGLIVALRTPHVALEHVTL